jgi:selenocysteine-specific elongation factor
LKLLDQEKADLKNAAQVKFHTGTSETPASVYLFQESPLKPGRQCLIQVFLEHPVVAGPRDHYIIRSLSPTRTLGGGIIIEAIEKRLKRTHPDVLKEIADRAQAAARPRDFVEYCVRTAEAFAADERQISLRSKMPLKELAALLAELVQAGRLLPVSGKTYIHVDTAERVEQHLLDIVRAFHSKRPESPGISRELLLTEFSRGEGILPLSSRGESVSPLRPAGISPAQKQLEDKAKMASPRKGGTPSPLKKDVFEALLARMLPAGRLVERKGFLALPEHREQFNNAEQQLLQNVEALFRSHLFDPPGPQEIADQMRVPPPQVQRVLRILTEQKQLVRVDQDLLFHAEAVATAKERLVSYIQQNGGLESVKFKYLLDTSRKYAIPLLDYFDKIGVTRRVGYTRLLK